MIFADITQKWNFQSIFTSTPNLIKLLIGRSPLSAKVYLSRHISPDTYNSTIRQFGEYTLEAIMIYVLGVAYHSIKESSIVRVSTFLGLRKKSVRAQANILKSIRTECSQSTTESSQEGEIKRVKRGTKMEIGRRMLEFMIEREVIFIESISENTKAIVKEKGKAFYEKNFFLVCNFDLGLLPLKLNLPMVCKPLDWEYPESLIGIRKLLLSDLRGGYRSVVVSFLPRSGICTIKLVP
ncbi:hypothetical protein IC582_030539 [Cucumis melo]